MIQRYMQQPIAKRISQKITQKFSPLYDRTSRIIERAKTKVPDWVYYLFRKKRQPAQQRIVSILPEQFAKRISQKRQNVLKQKKLPIRRLYSTKIDIPTPRKLTLPKKTIFAGSITKFLAALTKRARAEDLTEKLKDIEIVDYDPDKDPDSKTWLEHTPFLTNEEKGKFNKAIYTQDGRLIGRIAYCRKTP